MSNRSHNLWSITNPRQRGVALLLVLVALVLGLTAATIAAQVAVTASLTRKLDQAQVIADDAASGLLPRIERWLATESDRTVLPPDAEIPATLLIDETIHLDAMTSMQVEVTAYDQHGMVPWTEVGANGPLADLMTSEMRDAVHERPLPQEVSPGLDLINATPSEVSAGIPVWPRQAKVAAQGGLRQFGSGEGASQARATLDSKVVPLGALVATHCSGRPSINVNTAPHALIARVEELTQRSVWTEVSEQRANGKPASVAGISDLPGSVNGTDRDAVPTFVSTSDVWSFRVDVTLDGARSSWWITYLRSDRGWTLRQRLRVFG